MNTRLQTWRLIALAVVLAAGLLGLPLVSGWLIVSNHQADLKRRSATEADHMIGLIADGMRQPIWDLNPDAGEAIVGAIEADPRFVSVSVTSVAQGDFLYYAKPQPDGADIEQRSVPVIFEGRQIGEVHVRIDRNRLLAVGDANWLESVVVIGVQLLFSLAAVVLLVWLAMRVARDRTLTAASRELEAFRKLLQATIDASPVTVSIKDRHLRYVFANRTALEKMDVRHEEIVGHPLPESVGRQLAASYLKQVDEQDRKVLATGQAVPPTAYATGRAGTWSETLLSKTPILDDRGDVSHIVTVGVDVTELKRAEEAALKAKEEAEMANMAKSQFLASMSHELRTPLNAIIGFSEVIMNETFGPLANAKYQEYIRDIHQSGDHLHTIITDLLDVARIEVGAFELDLEDVDIGKVLAGVRTMLLPKANRAGVALVDRCARPLPAVRGDVVRLRQIFINLVDNAIKFTDPGGRISIDAEMVDGGSLAVTVSDTGIGIAAGDLERIVEPFVCIQDVATRNVSGTGLGLSFVKSLTEMHGGDLRIASQPGHGTTVVVTLPRTGATIHAIETRLTA